LGLHRWMQDTGGEGIRTASGFANLTLNLTPSLIVTSGLRLDRLAG